VGLALCEEEAYPTYESEIARFDEVNQQRQRRGYTESTPSRDSDRAPET
jgi:hypothetical protein